MNGSVQEDGHGTAVAPFAPEQLDGARHEIGRDGLNGDVPKASAPTQFWRRKITYHLGNEQARQHYQGHEVTAAIEGATPPDEQRNVAEEQEANVHKVAALCGQAEQCHQAEYQHCAEQGGREQGI